MADDPNTREVAAARIDARPIRGTAADTDWDLAVALRDEMARHVRATLDKAGIQALVFSSANGNYPPWVKLEAWLPEPHAGAGCERAELLAVVDVRPYRRHRLLTNIEAKRGAASIRIEERATFPAAEITAWVRYAVNLAGKPASYRPFREALLALVPFRRRNPIERAYSGGFWGGIALPLSLLSLAAIAAGILLQDGATLLLLLGAVGLIATIVMVRRRRHAVFVPSQSATAPRNLGLVDSWQAAIADLGRDYDDVKARLVAGVSAEQASGLSFAMETYGYRTPNGFEERERLVVAKGQCVVQVHIYRFSDDLFVGWQAFLNWAQWAETSAVSTRLAGRQEIEFRELRQGYYVPSQFDMIDLNSLSELVHRRLERELKAILKEKEIEQEIDFKVIRGDRDMALDKERHADPAASSRGWRYVSTQPT